MERGAEPGNQVPFAAVVEEATARGFHVFKGDRLEHGDTTPMMAHVLDVDGVQVLSHGWQE